MSQAEHDNGAEMHGENAGPNQEQGDNSQSYRDIRTSTYAPINDLPTELLSEIMNMACRPRTLRFKLSMVCRRWRDVINSIKTLWKYIIIRESEVDGLCPPISSLRVILDRAGSIPIYVSITANVEDYPQIFLVLRDYAKNIRGLNLCLDEYDVDFLEDNEDFGRHLILLSMHSLKRLKISIYSSYPDPARRFVEYFLDVLNTSQEDATAVTIRFESHELAELIWSHSAFIKATEIDACFGKNVCLYLMIRV
ncbi:hypothetical protein CPB86DRAFT_47760 [Serendipita vermifera]|nr:hypothetical protein CPB86DRAFT_47760 [Serendipita vermifera]